VALEVKKSRVLNLWERTPSIARDDASRLQSRLPASACARSIGIPSPLTAPQTASDERPAASRACVMPTCWQPLHLCKPKWARRVSEHWARPHAERDIVHAEVRMEAAISLVAGAALAVETLSLASAQPFITGGLVNVT